MHLHFVDYVLWFTAPVLQVWVLIAMLRRGLQSDYPYFFSYTILQVVAVPVLYVINVRSYDYYFYSYYCNIALSVLLSFGVLQEIFHDAFRPYEALRDLSVILFRYAALIALLVGVMWAISEAQKPLQPGQLMVDTVLLADRSLRLMQCGLVFFLLLFSEYLGISRRSLVFGVSLGFGFFAAVNMLVFTGFTHQGILHTSTLRQINSGAYLMSVVIWLGYTLASAPSRKHSPAMRSGDWNSALEDARVAAPAESLLDIMDRTVDDLMHRRQPPLKNDASWAKAHSN